MVSDPIADMLTRIRNAQAIKRPEVVMPMSRAKFAVAKILERESWIYKAEVIKIEAEKNKRANFDELRLVLKYKKSGRPAITKINRISRPGLRVYVNSHNLPKVLNNFGIAIISTSSGLMTNKEAKKQGLGGEVICEVY